MRSFLMAGQLVLGCFLDCSRVYGLETKPKSRVSGQKGEEGTKGPVAPANPKV